MYIIWTSYMHIICTPYALCTFQSFHRSPLTRRLPVVSPRRSLDFLREMRRTQIRPNHNTRRLVANFRRGLGPKRMAPKNVPNNVVFVGFYARIWMGSSNADNENIWEYMTMMVWLAKDGSFWGNKMGSSNHHNNNDASIMMVLLTKMFFISWDCSVMQCGITSRRLFFFQDFIGLNDCLRWIWHIWVNPQSEGPQIYGRILLGELSWMLLVGE